MLRTTATMGDEQKPGGTGWAERPEHKQYDVTEGEYEPAHQAQLQAEKRAGGNAAKGAGGILVALGVLAAKFKGLLFLLLNLKWLVVFKGLLLGGGSFLVSLWFYSLFFGWKFALVFVLMMLAHELGHFVTIRNYGLPAKLPMFIPGWGAYTMGGVPESLESDAYIALAGPITGLGVSAICYWLGLQAHDTFWIAAAYLGAFVNAFNLLPVLPFDGGRVAGALSPALWFIGFVLFLALSFAFGVPLFFTIIFALFALPSAIAGFRGFRDPRFATRTGAGRLRVAFWYLLTLGALLYLMTISHVTVPR